jgi:hypothetical protein
MVRKLLKFTGAAAATGKIYVRSLGGRLPGQCQCGLRLLRLRLPVRLMVRLADEPEKT